MLIGVWARCSPCDRVFYADAEQRDRTGGVHCPVCQTSGVPCDEAGRARMAAAGAGGQQPSAERRSS